MTDIYAAPPRPRLAVALAAQLREALGKRDLTKGERSACNELIVSLRCMADAVSPWYHARQIDAAEISHLETEDPEESEDEKRRRLSQALFLRGLHRERLDGLWRLFLSEPDRFSADERSILPIMLTELILHGLRRHAGHAQAVPTHVAEAIAHRKREAERAAQQPAHDRLDQLGARIEDVNARAEAAATATTATLNQIVGTLETLMARLPTPSKPDA